MYHIKPDKRSQASAAEVVLGLQECLRTTPLKSITVTDIHRVTGISRATFYRLFDTPEDVLIYQLDQMTEGVAETYETKTDLSTRQLVKETIALGLENHEFIKALVVNGRHDLLFQYTEKSFRRLLSGTRFAFLQNMEKTEREYIIAHLSMTMVASQIAWSRNGQKETAQDMIRYLKRYGQIITEMVGEE